MGSSLGDFFFFGNVEKWYCPRVNCMEAVTTGQCIER